jgi:mRNA interferase MazF
MPPFGDWLVCGVSTQLRQRVVELDEVIDVSDGDFVASGLKATSVIRLGFLPVMPTAKFLGAIGSISNERRVRLLRRLPDYLRAR